MKRVLASVVFAGILAAAPQQFKLNFDQLGSKASNTVDISLNRTLLQLAAKFLDSGDSDEAHVKKLVANLDGIYIRHFEFKSDHAWSQADADSVRNQLRAPEWSRIVGVKSDEDGENVEIYMRVVDGKTSGVAILATEAREFTVINIVGNIDLDDLGALSGHFDLPKLAIPKGKK